ncbi:hypothetical protein PG985_015807 [Apiospora marii]|uniref:Uncharacterized protein n=1 Tax=Apiospora marii TaxID=335849 RepID=A0ABR1S4B7_9PEZI
MSASQNLIQKMSDMSLTDDNKTRHESKLLYRMDHLSLSSPRAVKQTNLPSTFSPTPFDHSWKEKLPASQSYVTEAGVGDSKHNRPEGDLKDADVDTIEAAPSEIKAAVRSDPNESKNTEYFHQGDITSALASNPEPKECFECGKWFIETDNGPNACVFHWALPAEPGQGQKESPATKNAAEWSGMGVGLLRSGPRVEGMLHT